MYRSKICYLPNWRSVPVGGNVAQSLVCADGSRPKEKTEVRACSQDWGQHFQVSRKASRRLYYLREYRRALQPTDVGLTTYITMIRPLLEYSSPVKGGLPSFLADELDNYGCEFS